MLPLIKRETPDSLTPAESRLQSKCKIPCKVDSVLAYTYSSKCYRPSHIIFNLQLEHVTMYNANKINIQGSFDNVGENISRPRPICNLDH